MQTLSSSPQNNQPPIGGAVGVADAEFPELGGVAGEGAVVEGDRETDPAAVAHRGADAVDRGDELRMVRVAADAERARQVGGAPS
jgi:hypothetical protein